MAQDNNQLAKSIVDQATEEKEETPSVHDAAVYLGRMGGKKGGPARAAKLSKEERSKIAAQGAKAKWKKWKEEKKREAGEQQNPTE